MFGLQGAERRVAFAQRGAAARSVPVQVPAWADRLVVELAMPRDQWPLFTDLGLSVVDDDGQVLKAEPLNYAVGRLSLDLEPGSRGRRLHVLLLPGFADPDPTPLWEGELSIRLYAPSPVLLPQPVAHDLEVPAGARITRTLVLGKAPWPLADGFFPLGQLVLDAGGTLWGREVPLPEPRPPLMR
jgi:hypothetical protein